MLLLIAMLFQTPAPAMPVPSAPVEIAPGMHLIRTTPVPGRGPDGNTVIIDAPEGLIVVDTGRHKELTDAIREARIDRSVSVVAGHTGVRRAMRRRQRELGLAGDAVVEGRDIGTVVFPDAEVKVFLVADPSERARRREAERPDAIEDTATDLRLRDALDQAQSGMAPDAQVIDTTNLTLEEVVARIEGLIATRTS